MTKYELDARSTVYHSEYCHKIQVEAKCLTDMVMNQVVPPTTEYQLTLAGAIAATKAVQIGSSGDNTRSQQQLLATITTNVNRLINETENVTQWLAEAESMDPVTQARYVLLSAAVLLPHTRERLVLTVL